MRAKQLLFAAAIASIVPFGAVGCSSSQTSTTTTRTTVSPDYASGADTSTPPPAQTTTTTTTTNEPDSVLGATVHLAGTIIMLPFRVVGLIL